MFKKRAIIIGIILLLAIGALATFGWAGLKMAEKKTEKPKIEIPREAKEAPETTTTTTGTTTSTADKEEVKKLSDEEFLERIFEMEDRGWRFLFFKSEEDEKGELVWKLSFKQLLQMELNLTSNQLENLRKFLSKKREIMRQEIPEIRKILNGKEEELLEWVEEIIDFYEGLSLASTPRPKSTEQLNSIKEELFKSEWYERRLEKKSSKFLLSIKNLNLSSSQEVKIKDFVKDSIKKIDDLKAQLCAVQHGYYIEKTKKITQSSMESAIDEKGKSIVENIANLIKLRNEQIKKFLTKEQILKFFEEFR